MPKMTHWNSADPIDVAPEKAAVYAAQGWQTVEGRGKAPAVAMTTAAVDEPAPVVETSLQAEPAPVKKSAAKKAPAKKASKKS